MMESRDTSFQFHSLSAEEIPAVLQTDARLGLTDTEAAERIRRTGKNRIDQVESGSVLKMFLGQFRSPIVFLLLSAAALSFWMDDLLDAGAILSVLLINSFIGFYMEYQAERSMDVLKKMSSVSAKVIRGGVLSETDAENLVPGDLVYVEAGDLVPADGRILRQSGLKTDESAMTGESVPVTKSEGVVPAGTILAERTNMLYKGTSVLTGNAFFAIAHTGMLTELGKVARLVEVSAPSATPLEKKISQFSRKLLILTVGLAVLILVAGLLHGQRLPEMLETAIALAVAAIPEGLPIVATLALARGMLKMARHQVIVKRLSAVETLGSTTVICTDKTGTLTMNRIEVTSVIPAAPDAEARILEACVLCNTAEIRTGNGKEEELGDPLETGLLKYALKHGADISGLRRQLPKIKEEPFSSETKIMCTRHPALQGYTDYAKGAAEELIRRCDRLGSGNQFMDEAARAFWLAEAERMAASGLRVIAAAFKTTNSEEESLSSRLVFLGLIGMMDPPRTEVSAAIRDCQAAGIRVVMITGDHPSTARHIAGQLGIGEGDREPVILGKEMKDPGTMGPEEKDRWALSRIFARVSPKQKLDLIRVLQERHQVVAMTGDGINDAPALKKADIGVAMGIRGTQVAQEVAAMILRDDSFTSIALAIRQGRVIYDNIRKFVVFLLSCNLSELLVIASAAIFNLHFQLIPLQILFINLVTDVLPALALGTTEGGPGVMNRLPRNSAEPVLDRQRWFAVFFYAAVISAASLSAVLFSHYALHAKESWNATLCNNILFFSLILAQLLHVFNMNSPSTGLFRSEITRNRYIWVSLVLSALLVLLAYSLPTLRRILGLGDLSMADGAVILVSAAASMILIRIAKKLKWIRS